jgi:UDP-N-acetylmuramoyl-L-alanyl-D-glutamate--2,6-diaminopimelate ligase
MTFEQLLEGAEVIARQGDSTVRGIAYDSRKVQQGFVFVAMHGETSDGNRFIDQAIAAGVSAVVTDSPDETPRPNVAWAQVPNGRRALGRLSANFYKRPAERLAITGITGTNGKSTTTFLVESILHAAGRKSVLVGTIEYHVAGKSLPAPHTTPEALELNEMLSQGLANGATEVVMEVSSHALAQQRVFAVPFDVAVFTNLTRDHLDYHQTMDEYGTAACSRDQHR